MSPEPIFVTPRLRCRRWVAGDLDAIHAVYSDPLGMAFVGDGSPITLEGCREWLAVTERNYALRGYGMFALEERATAHVVGFCGLVHPGGQPEPEVKYAFLQAAWGKGYATEAISHLLSYGHQAHGLTRIMATVAPDNLASQRVLSKAGAKEFGSRSNEDGSTTLLYEWTAPHAA